MIERAILHDDDDDRLDVVERHFYLPPTRAPLTRLAVADQPARGFWWVGADRVFVGLAAPAGPVGHGDMAVDEFRLVAEQRLVPVEPVDIDLHDPQIRHRGGE